MRSCQWIFLILQNARKNIICPKANDIAPLMKSNINRISPQKAKNKPMNISNEKALFSGESAFSACRTLSAPHRRKVLLAIVLYMTGLPRHINMAHVIIVSAMKTIASRR